MATNTGSSVAYACSKGALNSLTISLARALGPDIRVNAVLPGFTETRWLKQGLGDAYEPARENYRKQSALQTTMAPEDVAEAIVSLLHARKITGQLLTIDAGRGLGTAPEPGHRRPGKGDSLHRAPGAPQGCRDPHPCPRNDP